MEWTEQTHVSVRSTKVYDAKDVLDFYLCQPDSETKVGGVEIVSSIYF